MVLSADKFEPAVVLKQKHNYSASTHMCFLITYSVKKAEVSLEQIALMACHILYRISSVHCLSMCLFLSDFYLSFLQDFTYSGIYVFVLVNMVSYQPTVKKVIYLKIRGKKK